MAQATPLIIGPTELKRLDALRQRAASHPIDVLAVREQCKTPAGHAAYISKMARFTVRLPVAFVVTFSIETGHAVGPCRHLSASSQRKGRVLIPEALWMIAEAMGFHGGLSACSIWEENIGDGDIAINLIQPVAIDATSNIRH
jgi:hypothetical protein